MATVEPSEVEQLRAEVERHRNANLVRAVTEGYGWVDEWITDAINVPTFDRVPWMIAEKYRVKYERLRAIVAAHDAQRELGQCDGLLLGWKE